jgi:hypothetical protein
VRGYGRDMAAELPMPDPPPSQRVAERCEFQRSHMLKQNTGDRRDSPV